MPLTRERPYLFRGRANDRDNWFVVAPSVSDPDKEIEQWRETVAPSNSKRVARVGGLVLGWFCFLAVLAGSWALLWLMAEQEWPGWPFYAGAVGVLGVVLAAVLGLGVGIGIGGKEYVPSATETVMPVGEQVERWADDDIDVGELWELWELTYRLDAVSDFEDASKYGYDEDYHGPPTPLVEQAVAALLKGQLEMHRARLREVASRIGYPLEDAAEERSA